MQATRKSNRNASSETPTCEPRRASTDRKRPRVLRQRKSARIGAPIKPNLRGRTVVLADLRPVPDRHGSLPSLLTVVSSFIVSFGAAFLVSFALGRRQRPPRPRLPLGQLAGAFAAVIAVLAVIATLDVVSSDAIAVGGGCGIGILAGQWLGALHTRSSS